MNKDTIKEAIEAFDRIAQNGIPIRNPNSMMTWARMSLMEAYCEFEARYSNCVVGCTKPYFLKESDWKRGVEEGWLVAQLSPSSISWCYEIEYEETLKTKDGWLEVMKQVEKREGDSRFGGDLYALLKKQMRLQGLCGSWLRNYDPKTGRIYYGSLHPMECSTGRCAPRPSDGFLPGMGKEITKALLQAPKGREVYELDFKAQGLCILAALSHDPVMGKLAKAKDPYLAVAVILGCIPREEYQSTPIQKMKDKYSRLRDRVKKIMMSYQYGAGDSVLDPLAFPMIRHNGIKKSFDNLFSGYKEWVTSIGEDDYIMPDGFRTSGKIPSPTIVQGWDSYLLRKIVREIDSVLPKGAAVIATNHDCVWVETDEGSDLNPVKEFMENTANEVLSTESLFRVCIDRIG